MTDVNTLRDCPFCQGLGGGQVRIGLDDWEYQPCDGCGGTGQIPVDIPDAWCDICDELVHWINCPTGGWWAHDVHPSDGHEAEGTF